MSKHELFPTPMPPAKRLHMQGGRVEPRRVNVLTFENSIYDELALAIFSHLGWTDLCTARTVNRNWARLSDDNEIWKKQYLRAFGRPRLRGGKGFVGRSDGREIKPLPGRAQAEKQREDAKDWKWMFRVSSNWKRGTQLDA